MINYLENKEIEYLLVELLWNFEAVLLRNWKIFIFPISLITYEKNVPVFFYCFVPFLFCLHKNLILLIFQ